MIRRIFVAMLALFAAATFAATDVNTATQTELESVKGIGPSISTKILDARKSGPFKDWGDLVTRVKGVGDKNSTEFSAAGLTVNGAAKSGAPADPAAVRKSEKPATKAAAKSAPPAAATTTTPAPQATSPTPVAVAPPAAASAPTSAADKKAAAKEERDAKKAAKADEKARKKAAKAADSASGASAASKK